MNILYILIVAVYIHYTWLFCLVVICRVDTEVNPGPTLHSCHSFSIYHWNLNSSFAHNIIKVSLIRALTNKFDIICCLNLSVLSNDTNLDLAAYNLVRADHPSNTKRVVFASCLSATFF